MGRKGTYADPTGNSATQIFESNQRIVHATTEANQRIVDAAYLDSADDQPVNLNDPKRPLMVKDLDAKRFYLLKRHSIRLLEPGDMYVHHGRLVTVEDVKRKRAGGREVRLSNSYVFDSALPMFDDADIDIYRPRRGF